MKKNIQHITLGKTLTLFIIITFFSSIFIGCQFFFPTSSIDNEPFEIKLTQNYSLFDKNLVKYTNNDIQEIILFSIDSILKTKNNEFFMSKGGNYYYLKEDKLQKCSFSSTKLKCVNEFLKQQP